MDLYKSLNVEFDFIFNVSFPQSRGANETSAFKVSIHFDWYKV